MSPADKVDSLAVRQTAADLVSDQPSASGGTFHYHQVAELHRYVNENITYVPDPIDSNYVAPPNETLETEAGDCDCQAVLVASLCSAIGATTRLARCESETGDWHMLAEVYLADQANGETADVASSLADYYGTNGYGYNDFYYDHGDNHIWYPVDTAMGRYVGDIHQLANNGYIHGPESDGSWTWHNVEYLHP